MKAMVLKEYNQPLVYCEDYPDPVIREENDVIIKITACGLCTTDLKVQHGVLETGGLPRILGHEPAGVVTAVGSRVTNVKVGDRVISSTYMACRTCENCRRGRDTLCENLSGRLGITVDGGFAEYMLAKAQCLVKIPDDVDEAQACIVPCGGGVAYHAMVKRFQVGPEDRVLILGVGGLGIQAIEMCAICGAETIALDIDDDKLAAVKAAGATYAINTRNPRYLELLRELGGGTVLFDTTGAAKALRDCVSVLKKGARILLVAYGPGREVHLDMADVVLNEFEILGSRGVGIQDVAEIMSLIERKKYAPIVQRYPLSEINEVIDKLNSNKLIGRAVLIP